MKTIVVITILIVLLSGCSTNKHNTVTIKIPDENIDRKDLPKFVPYEKPPEPIKQVPPIYPEYLRNQKLHGQVWLEVEVLENGSVGRVEVKKSLHSSKGGLDESAVNAVKKWKFKPAESKGKPVASWVTFPITFSLE